MRRDEGRVTSCERRGPRVTCLASLVSFAILVPSVSQGQVRLTYHPGPGIQVMTVNDVRMSSVMFGFPSLPDSTVIDSDWRTVQVMRVLEVMGDRRRMRFSIDSTRAHSRIAPSPRADVPLIGVEGLAIDALVGPRLDIQSAKASSMGVADSEFVAVLRARMAGLEFQFPTDPIAPGFNWDSPLQFPLGAYLTVGGKLTAVESLRGTATVILDSVKARGTDTLAYLSVSGTFEPKKVAIAGEGGVGTGQVTGRIAAALLWSTGWNAVVSGATNGRFEIKLHMDKADGPFDGSVSLFISVRQQVRL